VKRRYVEPDNSEGISRGATIVDHMKILGKRPNVSVVYEASRDLFQRMLFRLLRGQLV
jgi:inosine-uridine nucleoside N-ribohydrolase